MLALAPRQFLSGLQAPRWQQLPRVALAGRRPASLVGQVRAAPSQDPQGDDHSTASPQDAVTLDSLASLLKASSKTQGEKLDKVLATQAAQGESIGALAERSVRVERYLTGKDEHLRQNVQIRTGDELLRWCSAGGHPASKAGLLHAVASHDALAALSSVVVQLMQKEAGNLGVKLPAFPSPASTRPCVKQWLPEARQILLAARGKGRGKAAWLTACKGLEAYVEAAGDSADEASLMAFLGKKEQGRLVLTLMTALATDSVYELLELDTEPVWAVTDQTVLLNLLEIKSQPTGIKAAVRQLKAHGNVLVEALAACNGAVLAGRTLHVVGTVAVATGKLSSAKKEHWQRLHLPVGGKVAAPKAAMQLWIER